MPDQNTASSTSNDGSARAARPYPEAVLKPNRGAPSPRSNGRTADTMGRTRPASIKASLCELDRGTQAWRVSAPWLPKRSTMPGDPATRNQPEKFRRLPLYAKQPPRGAMFLAARTTYLWSRASLEMPSSVRTVAPAALPVTAPSSAVAASASGNVAPTWSDSSPSASAATRTASRAPSART